MEPGEDLEDSLADPRELAYPRELADPRELDIGSIEETLSYGAGLRGGPGAHWAQRDQGYLTRHP
jgi:hypothetical protein